MTTLQFFLGEMYFAKRLRELRGVGIEDGLTDVDIRRERIRRVIIDCNLGSVRIGRRNGRIETFAEAFSRFYGEPLIKKARSCQ